MAATANLALAAWAMSLGVSAAIAQPAALPGPYGFAVEISLSPKAAAKLVALHETITLAASYTGNPAPGAVKHADEMGEIDLGRETVEIPVAAGRTTFTGRAVKLWRLVWLADPTPEVNVNVYSSRHSGPDNLLDCAFFQDKITVARRAPVKLNCKLIGEH